MKNNKTMGFNWNSRIFKQQRLPWKIWKLIIMKLYLLLIMILHTGRAPEVSSQAHKSGTKCVHPQISVLPTSLHENPPPDSLLSKHYWEHRRNTMTLQQHTMTRTFISERKIQFSSFKIKSAAHNSQKYKIYLFICAWVILLSSKLQVMPTQNLSQRKILSRKQPNLKPSDWKRTYSVIDSMDKWLRSLNQIIQRLINASI